MPTAIEALEQEAEAIRTRIEPKRQEIAADEQQLARLEQAIRVLNGQAPVSTQRRPIVRTSSPSVDDGQIIAFVAANPNTAGAAIGQEVGMSGNKLSMKLRRMQEAGLLRAEGTGRAKRYRVA